LEVVTDRRNVRYVTVRGVRYLRIEDVADIIRELGATEETDVRNRLDEAARNLTNQLK
jgi:hypothetical protein